MGEKELESVPVNMPKDILRGLQWLAEQEGTTATEALRDAIATQTYLIKEFRKKEIITIRKKNKVVY